MKKTFILLSALICSILHIQAQDVTYHFQEGFEKGNATGWIRNCGGTTSLNHGTYTGNGSIKFDNITTGEDKQLESPSVNGAGTLTFWASKNANAVYFDLHICKIVNGVTTEIRKISNTEIARKTDWTEFSIPIDDSSNNIKIMIWAEETGSSSSYLAIDDVSLTTYSGEEPEQSEAIEKLSTSFNDGTWGEIATSLPTDFPTYDINGFTLEKAIVHTGSMNCPSGEKHTNRITMESKSKGGAIILPLLKNVGEIEIHANAGTEGNQFALNEYINGSWNEIGSYATRKTPDSIHVITLNRNVETKLKISNNSGGKIVIYKIVTRTYQETQELNITTTTPAEGSTCYYNLTKNITLTFNKEIEYGTGEINLNNEISIPVTDCSIDGKNVTVPVTLESTPSGKEYTMTIPAGAFVEKGNSSNLCNEKVFSFNTFKTVAYPSNYESKIDVVYSTANVEQNRMDIYYPVSSGTRAVSPVPVVINIHGGGWNHGEKESQSGFNIYFNMGFAVANVEYRMTPHAKAPAAIEDVRCAMMYLLEHANELNIDPNKIIFQGGSAGGHLALVAGYLQNDGTFDTGCNNYTGTYKIIAVIDKYGPSHLTDFMFYSSLVNWLGDKATDTEFVNSISPALMVTANTPPTYVIHGDADPTVPYSQSETLVAALEAANVKHQFTTVPGGGHGGFPSEYNTQMNNEITVFLTEVLDTATGINTDNNQDDEVQVSMKNGILSVYTSENCLVSVYDVTGRKIVSTSDTVINLSQSAKGVLLIKVETANRSYLYKIIG